MSLGDHIDTLHWSPQGTYLAIGLEGSSGSIAIWNYVTDSLIAQIANPLSDRSYYLQWTADGQYVTLIFEGGYSTTVYYANARTGQVSKVYETPARWMKFKPSRNEQKARGLALALNSNTFDSAGNQAAASRRGGVGAGVASSLQCSAWPFSPTICGRRVRWMDSRSITTRLIS